MIRSLDRTLEFFANISVRCRSTVRWHYWAEQLGMKAGISILVGAFDAHWDAIGAGIGDGDDVNVVGTSTCIIAMSREAELIPGVCGIVPGSVHPALTGIEAGLSATVDIFDAIARRWNECEGALEGIGKVSCRTDRTASIELG